MAVSCCGGFGAAAEAQFTPQRARRELGRYRKQGPGVTTRLLRDGLTEAGLSAGTVLDVGAGIGALTFELLERGATSAVAVDASSAYLAAATEEAERRGRADVTTFVQGDFVTLAAGLPPADVVTLDRVVCCYPSYQPLLEHALRHAVRALALSYPRDRWLVKWVARVENAVRRVMANPFRTFVHPPPQMQQVIETAGFELVSRSQTRKWSSDVYVRRARDTTFSGTTRRSALQPGA